MREKQLSLFLVALALIVLMTVPAFADPVAATSLSIGDRYAITTVSDQARAWVADADCQFRIQQRYFQDVLRNHSIQRARRLEQGLQDLCLSRPSDRAKWGASVLSDLWP